ncbi:MAG: hypothetical protein OHK0045_17710 [Raineya sp.]
MKIQKLQNLFFISNPIEIKSLPAVLPYSVRGKMLVASIRFLYSILGKINRKWRNPLPDFEENPAYFNPKDILYLGYKYYQRPPYLYSESLIEHFHKQNFEFYLPEGFQGKSTISISAGGDLMPYEWIQKPYTQHLWDEVGEYFFKSDIVFANLETPIDLSRPPSLVPEVMLNDMLFNGSEEIFEIFSGNGKFKGYDVLSTANNHSYDMGKKGVFSTIEFLEKQKVAFTGTARSKEEQRSFPILERKGVRVAFIAYTYSLNKFILPENEKYLVNTERLNTPQVNLEQIKQDTLQAYKRSADIVVLSLHTGNAYQPYPSEHTVEVYHRIFKECGVDIILGSHPHNPQPMEKYTFSCPITRKQKQGFAIYSLADFVAYDIFVWDRLIPLLKIEIVKGNFENGDAHTQIKRVEVLPVYNWGTKNSKKPKEMRFLDLEQVVAQIKHEQTPAFMSKLCQKEALYLHHFWKEIFGAYSSYTAKK